MTKPKNNHNVQIQEVVLMIQDADPDLFGHGNAVLMPVKTNELSEKDKSTLKAMLRAAQWHADFQIEFWEELFAKV